ncbi:TPA: hypothetical protein ACSP2Q_001984 [Aeromonas veronii]|uniref:hypothetical protein n=1 Tax=Aeromonas veronii TaxID=654 RepID=UPI0024427F8F|nr:hypothetical protein [Aeromonas veronii]
MTVPRDAPAGRYLGNIQLLSQQQLVQLPLTIEVLPLTLPAASKPVGIYVEAPPYLNWLSPNPEALKEQIAEASRCDLQRLAKLGISGLSPALPQDEAGMREIPCRFSDYLLSRHSARCKCYAGQWHGTCSPNDTLCALFTNTHSSF